MAKTVTKNAYIQFGVFMALFGVAVAFIGTYADESVQKLMSQAAMMIIFKAIEPMVRGVRESWEDFMNQDEDDIDISTGVKYLQICLIFL